MAGVLWSLGPLFYLPQPQKVGLPPPPAQDLGSAGTETRAFLLFPSAPAQVELPALGL